jgi:hypothetical protein
MNPYTVKVPTGLAAVSSAQVQARLHEFYLSGSASWIAADPGAGDHILRLSLPQDQVTALAAKLGDPPAVALRRLIATPTHGNPTNAQAIPGRSVSATRDSWFERHPVLTLMLFFAGIVGLLWWLFRKNGGPPPIPGPLAPALLVSEWSPLQ